jgi:hypothetical protein
LPRIVFLVYYPRSGSTLLSSRLDRFEDIGVTVESKFMREILLVEKDLRRAKSAEEVYALLRDVGKLRNFDLAREGLSRYLRDGGGYRIEEVTRAILSAYFEKTKTDSKVWVVKDGLNGYWMQRISHELPGAKFIHLVRDGRGVFNSVLRTASFYGSGTHIARDPVSVSRSWASFVGKVNGFAARNADRCITCRYEDLVAGEEGGLARLRDLLDLGDEGRETTNGAYYERMSGRDRALHHLVAREILPGRASAWREELDRGYRLAFEFGAGEALKDLDYEVTPGERLPHLLLDRDFVAALVSSAVLQALRWIRLLLDPSGLRRFISTKHLARRDVPPSREKASVGSSTRTWRG